MKWKAILQVLLGTALSSLFVILVLRKVDFEGLTQSLQQAEYIYLTPVVFLIVIEFWIRAYRWKYIFASIKDIKTHRLFSATMVGFGANNVLPARLGEIVRAYVIAKIENVSKSASLATIVVDRLFDGLALFFFAAIVLLSFPFPQFLKGAGIGFFIFYVASLSFITLLGIKREETLRVVSFILNIFPQAVSERTIRFFRSFSDGLTIFADGRSFLIAFLLSLLMWFTVALIAQCVIAAFDLDLPIYAALVITIIVCLGIVIPSGPGFVGTFQYFCILSLRLFDIPKDLGLGFSIVLHAIQITVITLLGLFYFWKEHLSLRDLAD